jgi:hypothetical protein
VVSHLALRELLDEVGPHEGLHGAGRGHREAAPRQLLHREQVGQKVGPARIAHAEKAHLAGALKELPGKAGVFVEVGGLGPDLLFGAGVDGLLDGLLFVA